MNLYLFSILLITCSWKASSFSLFNKSRKISKLKISEYEKIKLFTNIVQKDNTLKSLLVSKLRFMNSKLIFLKRYKSSLSMLKTLVAS